MRTDPHIPDPDGFHDAWLRAHEGLAEDASADLDTRLVLLLANQIGDQQVLLDCIAKARAAVHAPTFPEFERNALARGFHEVLVREWQPGQVVDTHAHPFAADALVVDGEMWLTVGTDTRHLRAGDTFVLAQGEPHAERYGPVGATYWVARRNGA